MKPASFTAERRQATQYWNELLARCSDPDGLVEGLVGAQREQGLWLGDRPFCLVARPRLVAAAEMVVEEHAATYLCSAVKKVHDRVLADRELRTTHHGHFNEWAQTILSLEPCAHETWSILRLDSFLTADGLQFVEVNGDIPMGSVCNDGLAGRRRTPAADASTWWSGCSRTGTSWCSSRRTTPGGSAWSWAGPAARATGPTPWRGRSR